MRSLRSHKRQGSHGSLKWPGLPSGLILALALGIGASATMLAVLHETLFRSFPASRPEQWVASGDATTDEASIARQGGRRSAPASRPADNRAQPQHICAGRTGASRVNRRKAAAESAAL